MEEKISIVLQSNDTSALFDVLINLIRNENDIQVIKSILQMLQDRGKMVSVLTYRKSGQFTIGSYLVNWGDISRLKLLIKWGLPLEMLEYGGRTLLQHACYDGKAAMTKRLVDSGSNIHATDWSGMGVLHCLLSSAGAEVVPTLRILLEHGACTDVRDRYRRLPIDVLQQNGYIDTVHKAECIKLLEQYSAS